MKQNKKARHNGTGARHSHKDTKKHPFNNTGRWRLMIEIQTRETAVIPANSNALDFPGSQWDETYFGSFRECLNEQKKVAPKHGKKWIT